MTGRRSHGRLSALNGVVHQGTSLADGEVIVAETARLERKSVFLCEVEPGGVHSNDEPLVVDDSDAPWERIEGDLECLGVSAVLEVSGIVWIGHSTHTKTATSLRSVHRRNRRTGPTSGRDQPQATPVPPRPQ